MVVRTIHVPKNPTDELAPTKGRDVIAERIRQDIMAGKLKFGAKLSENTYATIFGVSRTPVREAIVSLSSLGLLTVRPRSGTYVVSFTQKSLTDLFQVRETLEVSGVRFATPTQRQALVSTLEGLGPEMEREDGSPEDFDKFSLADTLFHTHLVGAPGNALLSQMYRPVAASCQAARSRLEKTFYVSDTANTHHTQIVEAIKADDLERFSVVLHEHLSWVLGMLMQVRELFLTDRG